MKLTTFFMLATLAISSNGNSQTTDSNSDKNITSADQLLIALTDPQGLQNFKIKDADLAGASIDAWLCYHSSFENVDFTSGFWRFSRVTRFCNFTDSVADHATFEGWFVSQQFTRTSLRGATFILDPRSNVTFKDCDLEGATIIDNGAVVKIENSQMSG